MGKYLTVKNVLLNEIRSLSRRIDTLMESDQSELEKDFNEIKNIFKDCPQTKEEAILKGFKPKDNDSPNSNPTEFSDKNGKIVINFEAYKETFKKYYNNKYAEHLYIKYFTPNGFVYMETCSQYFPDLERYGPEFSEYIFIDRTLFKKNGVMVEEYSAFTKDHAIKNISKPWFLIYDEKTIKKAKDIGFDLSNIESSESF
jgi:hypothetical protein